MSNHDEFARPRFLTDKSNPSIRFRGGPLDSTDFVYSGVRFYVWVGFDRELSMGILPSTERPVERSYYEFEQGVYVWKG